jgi:hypothetical protein
MALSTNTIDYNYQTTAGNGTTADATVQPADNCHTITVVNLTAAVALVGIVASGTALTTANSATLPANGSMTLKIGTVEYRPGGIIGGSDPQRLRINDAGAVAVTLSMQYLNSTQPVAP